MRILIAIFCISLLSAACKSKKDLTGNKNAKVTEKMERKEADCSGGKGGLAWIEYSEPVHEGVNGQAKLFETSIKALDVAMTKNFAKGEFEISLPFYIEGQIVCKRFRMTNSATISQAKQKEMRIYSFKGEDINDQTHTLRMDYDLEFGLRAYGFFDGQSYLLLPVWLNDKKLYISYNKQHADALKTEFEIKE